MYLQHKQDNNTIEMQCQIDPWWPLPPHTCSSSIKEFCLYSTQGCLRWGQIYGCLTLPSSSTVITPSLSQSKSLKASFKQSMSSLESCLSGLSLSVFLVIAGQLAVRASPCDWLAVLTTTLHCDSSLQSPELTCSELEWGTERGGKLQTLSYTCCLLTSQ